MKKGLLAVVVVLACALVGAGIATAAEISTSGAIQFKVSGTSEEGKASGLFGAGDVLVDYHVEVTSGPWTGVVSPEFDIAGGAVCECDAYITYTSDMATLTLDPTGIDYGLYDLYACGAPDITGLPTVARSIDGGPNMPSKAGIKAEIPFEPLTLTAVVNNQESGADVLWNFGFGVDYTMESLTLGLMGNSACKDAPWYGTSYGLKAVYEMAPMTFTGQYGSFSPSTDGYESGSGYYVEFDYATDEMGNFVVSYKGADANFNGAGTATDHAYSKIYGEWGYPLTDAVTFTADVASEDRGWADVGATPDVDESKSITSYEVKIGVSF